MLPGIPSAFPRFMAGFARSRNCVETPTLVTCVGIEGSNEATNAVFATGNADDNLVF